MINNQLKIELKKWSFSSNKLKFNSIQLTFNSSKLTFNSSQLTFSSRQLTFISSQFTFKLNTIKNLLNLIEERKGDNVCMEGFLLSSSLWMHYVVLSICLLSLIWTSFCMLGFWLVINMLGIWKVQYSCIQLFLQGCIGSLFSTIEEISLIEKSAYVL